MHDDVREVAGHMEFFQNGKQISVAGDLIPQTIEEMSALRDALYDETTFGERYVFNTHNFEILGKVSAKLNRHATLPTAITKTRLFESYQLVEAAGGITEFGNLERVPEEVEEAPAQRTNDGRFATEHDLLRQEVRRLLSDPTVSAQSIRQRADRDRDFGDAFRAELTAPAPTAAPPPNDFADLENFAQRWRKAKNVRPIGGKVKLDEATEYAVPELESLINRASAAGLL